jgi:hypothetical protein
MSKHVPKADMDFLVKKEAVEATSNGSISEILSHIYAANQQKFNRMYAAAPKDC